MPKMSKKVSGKISVDTYAVFARAVEEGVGYGWNRAYKHTNSPEPDVIKDEIINAVTNAVCEVFFFDRPAEE